jgi:cell division protease FtsH
MRRFFKSAAFPILLVVILAFVAQRLISPGSQTETPSFNQFQALIEQNQIKEATFNTKDNTIDVEQRDGTKYTEAYPDSDSVQAQLFNQMDAHSVEVTVKGKGGSSLLSLLTYILPFVLFFGFWIFLLN